MKTILLIFILIFASPLMIFAQTFDETGYPELISGRPVRGEIPLSLEGINYATYTMSIDDSVFAVRLSLTGAEQDLDLYVKYGEEIENYDDVDWKSEKDTYYEELIITRFSDPPLQNGIYFIDAAYQMLRKQEASIPFSLALEAVPFTVKEKLVPGKIVRSALTPESGMAAFFSFEIPKEAESARIYTFDTSGDVDMIITRDGFPLSFNDGDYLIETYLSREEFAFDGIPGKYTIGVFDQVSNAKQVSFSLYAGLEEYPPAFLLHIPPFPPGSTAFDKMMAPVVEIITKDGRGSGCIISKKGHVLTNWHVVQDFSGNSSPEIYAAPTFNQHTPPVEVFRIELIEVDEERDLAFGQIVSGRYGQPLPTGYVFPFFALKDYRDVSIGEEIFIIGYPSVGGTGSRASITMTRGIISGFEKTISGGLIKTDGEINTGSSGGACITEEGLLIGLPTRVIGEESSQIGYITPVSGIPGRWRYILQKDR